MVKLGLKCPCSDYTIFHKFVVVEVNNKLFSKCSPKLELELLGFRE